MISYISFFVNISSSISPSLQLKWFNEKLARKYKPTLRKGEDNMTALLSMTRVCTGWETKLIGSPLLWSSIRFDDADEDSLAMIAIFIHLSGRSRLSLRISVPLSSQWEHLRSMLVPQAHRIKEIILQPGKGLATPSKSTITDAVFSGTLELIIQGLGSLPALRYLDVISDRPIQLGSYILPAGLLSTGNWIIPYEHLRMTDQNRRQVTIHEEEFIDTGPILWTMSLEHLTLCSDKEYYTEFQRHIVGVTFHYDVPPLISLIYHGQLQWEAAHLLKAASPSLQHLELQVSIEDLRNVGPAIEHLHSLRFFTLTILAPMSLHDRRPKSLPASIANWGSTVNQTPSHNQGEFKCLFKSLDPELDVEKAWMGFHHVFPKLSILLRRLNLRTASLRLLAFDQAAFDKIFPNSSSPIISEEFWETALPFVPGLLTDAAITEAMTIDTMSSAMCIGDAQQKPTNYGIYAIPSNFEGILRFHWGQPIPVIWRAPLNHSRRDWVGIYKDGENKDSVTNVPSDGRWVPLHDDEWDGRVARPPREYSDNDMAECGELVFKGLALPWEIGEHELRYHVNGGYEMVTNIRRVQIYLDPPSGFGFDAIHKWLLRIVFLAFDSDPDVLPTLNCSTYEIQDEFYFRFDGKGKTTSRQAMRISYAVKEGLKVDLKLETIIQHPDITELTNLILQMLSYR